MYLGARLKALWSRNMSRLLELGLSTKEVAEVEHNITIINRMDSYKEGDAQLALRAFETLNKILVSKINTETVHVLYKEVYGWTMHTCLYTGHKYPHSLMIEAPNSSGKYICIYYVVLGHPEWELTTDRQLVRRGYLYGDKDIMTYSADPLQFLKFKTMPDERITYDTNQDPCCNEEYNGYAPLFLGIELEVERKKDTPKRIEHMVAADLGMDYMILKGDGSLDNGFEIVTAPATLRYHLQAWDKFFENSAKHLNSWISTRCGMHIHMTRKAFTPMHLGKLIAFFNNNENRDFITSIAGRSSSYAKFNESNLFHTKSKIISQIATLDKQILLTNDIKAKDNLVKQIKSLKELSARNYIGSNSPSCKPILEQFAGVGSDRYSAVNLRKPGTVEIRIFRGNVVKTGMLKNIEFVDAVVRFTRDATFRTRELTSAEQAERILKRKENTDYALHYTYFLDWLSKDTEGSYNNLKLWLATHNVSDKFTRKKLSDKAPANKRITDEAVQAVA